MNLEDIRIVTADFALTSGAGLTSGGTPNLGPFVAKAHMRNILALKYQIISGLPTGTSNAAVSVYDTWGTSNNLIDKVNWVAMSGGQSPNAIVMWPNSPRPDMPIGHVKESGVAQVYVSGLGCTVTMVYTDKPGGTY